MSTLRINDIDVYYEWHGSGEPLVFLHGPGSSTRHWEQQLAFSATNHLVLLVIHGHRRTSKPEGLHSIVQFSEDLNILLGRLELPHCHLVGMSMGAMVAMQCTLDHPNRIKSVVAIYSPACMRPRGMKQWLMVAQRKILVLFFGIQKVGQFLANRLFPSSAYEMLRQTFASRWAENDFNAYRAELNVILKWDVTSRLAKFQPGY